MTKTDNCNKLPCLSRMALIIGLIVSFASLQAQPKPINGKASFYADFFHGRKTANGERFNMNGLTAAHKSLPFGTILKVTNTANNKSVMVRINDRGPYVRGRMLDLSLGAAKMIGMTQKGVASVLIEPINNKDAYQDYLEKYENIEYNSVPVIVDAPQQKAEQELYYASEPTKPSQESYNEEQLFASINPNDNYYTSPAPASYNSDAWNETLKYTPEGTFSMGKALIYADAQEGKKMSNGEAYNSSIYTCAHNKYPLGRYLKVTRKNNPDLSVVVKVTDNHPGISDYDIQLSWTAASDLDLFNTNDTEVIIEEIAVTDLDALPDPNQTNTIQPERSVEIAFYNGGAALTGDPVLPSNSSLMAAALSPSLENVSEAKVENKTASGLGLFHLEASRTPENGYGVQVAVLTSYREILELSDKLYASGFQNTMVHSDMVNKQEMLRFIVGPYFSKEDAQICKDKLEKEHVYGMIIRLEPLGIKD